jgi:hypothetical protein
VYLISKILLITQTDYDAYLAIDSSTLIQAYEISSILDKSGNAVIAGLD